MSTIAIPGSRWSLRRFLRSLLALLVSLFLLASASIEAGRRLHSQEQEPEGRLTQVPLSRDAA